MNIFATPFGLPADAPELARRFAMIMAGLGAVIARRFVKMPHLAGLTLLLWGRLNRAVRRFHRALTWPATPGMARVRTDRARPARLQLPAGRGWLVRELGWEAATYLGQLEALLAEAGTQAALAAAPGAARIIRPICRMLGVPAAVTPKIQRIAERPDRAGPPPARPNIGTDEGCAGGAARVPMAGPIFSDA